MRAPGLPMLSCLLLTAQMLLVGAQALWPEHATGRGWRYEIPIPSRFLTPDRAKCYVTVKDRGEDVALKVQCIRLNSASSCVFAGNPKACTASLAKSRIYWKQLASSLFSQERLCEDDRVVLSTRVCGSSFPESNFRLVQPSQVATASKDRARAKFPWKMPRAKVIPTDSGSTAKISDSQGPFVTSHLSLELSESEITTTGPGLGPQRARTLPGETMVTTRSNSQADPAIRIESPQLADMDMGQEMVPWIYQDLLLKSYIGPQLERQDSPPQSSLGPGQVDQD
ncbi:fibroblast growth factor-binding protein 1-like [Sorex araneus]|uniref:fibroblast growth factor-binding protein 1-like n=1 Tax=Sorex araneus TaxID=42254 RepID=UPI002433A280|nr:fibroblast growth factor-binding protein 1-like [Sorex araneus]